MNGEYIMIHHGKNRSARRAEARHSRRLNKYRVAPSLVEAMKGGDVANEPGLILSLDPRTRARQWAYGIGRSFIDMPVEAFESRRQRRAAMKAKRREAKRRQR